MYQHVLYLQYEVKLSQLELTLTVAAESAIHMSGSLTEPYAQIIGVLVAVFMVLEVHESFLPLNHLGYLTSCLLPLAQHLA